MYYFFLTTVLFFVGYSWSSNTTYVIDILPNYGTITLKSLQSIRPQLRIEESLEPDTYRLIISRRYIENNDIGAIVDLTTNKMAGQLCIERNDSWDMLENALKKNRLFNVNQTDTNNWNMLHSLALSHHETTTKLTILDPKKRNDETLYLRDCLQKNMKIASYLIEMRGIKKDQIDIHGYTPHDIYLSMSKQPCSPDLLKDRQMFLQLLKP